MAIIFDGRSFAKNKEVKLGGRVSALSSRGVIPKLVSILVGDDPASKLYVGLKEKRGEEIGVQVEAINLRPEIGKEELIRKIKCLNSDVSIGGIMIQLPLPGRLQSSKTQILNSILPEKDVDGLREDSPFLHPTSKAVIEILDEAKDIVRPSFDNSSCKVVVIGATGMVGRPLVKELRNQGYKVIECNTKTSDLAKKTLQADVVVSATGIPGIITFEMVKNGAIIIDVGSPKGDADPSVALVASFLTPVPGGVGPVTVSCLLENLIQKYEN